MHILSLACCLVLAANAGVATAEPAAPNSVASAPSAKFSTSATQLGALLADPGAKAVLLKYIPDLVNRPDMSERASGMTLREIQDALKSYAPDLLNDDVLAKIDHDLAALPAAN